MTDGLQGDQAPATIGWFIRVTWLGPAALAAIFVAILGGLLWLMQQRALDKDRSDLVSSAGTAREGIRQRLDASRGYLGILAEDAARNALNPDLFQKRLSQYMADHPELVSVLYVDAEGTTRLAAPQEASRKAVGLPPACPESRAGFESACATGRAAYSRPHISLQGEPAFDVNVPIFRDEHPGPGTPATPDEPAKPARRFLGTIVGVYSCERLLRHMLQRETLQKHQASLIDRQGNVIVGLPTASEVDERLIEAVPLDPPGHGLSLRLARYGAGFWGFGLALLSLLCVGLVVGMAWGLWSLNRQVTRRSRAEEALRQARDELAQRVRERTADLEDANCKLQQEMTERQRAEERARQHQDQLAHVARISTMGEMAAGLAHELNQPLGAIASFAEGGLRMIEAGPPDLGDLHGAMEEVAQQAQRAGRIIQRLRAFVTKSTPQRSPGDIARLTREVVDLLAMDIRQNQIDFDLDFPQDLPQVLVDRIQVQQVLLNLMRNAIEAMEKTDAAGRRLAVGASHAKDGMIEVAVSDSGPACPPEAIPRIFEAFYTTKDSGIGMGLSISRSIVEAHGGKLWATSNTDGGLTFRFTLPVCPGEADEPSGERTRSA